MAPVEIMDEHYYGICAVVTIAMQLSCFFIAYSCKFDTITDFSGSTNFVLLAFLTLALGGHWHDRQIITTMLLTISRLELALFLLYRVIKRKKDARFDKVRENFLPFLVFWIFQMIWVYGVSLPVFRVNAAAADPKLCGWDYLGWITWALGFFLQVSADFTKLRFRANPANKGICCDVGVWRFSRHPNYFGEMLIWLGIFLTTVPVWREPGESDGWITLISPVLTFVILMFLSGMPTAEGQSLKRFYEGGAENRVRYETYRARTPPLVPFSPSCYAALPVWAKRIFCFEFKMYEYQENDATDTFFTPA
jgi:steroid 5-alpha reductase family enzyme